MGDAHSRDRHWLIPLAGIAGLQVVLWWMLWRSGYAPPPMFAAYGLLAYVFLAAVGIAVLLVRLFQMMRAGERRPLAGAAQMLRDNAGRIISAIVAVQLYAFGSAAFSALKFAIPAVVPFWLDRPLAAAEAWLVGMQPWEVSHRLLGWATPAIDFIYASWLPVQIVAFNSLLLLRASPLKTRALVCHSLCWLILGVGGAYLMSSAGPIFYERAIGGDDFAGLAAALRDAPVAVRTSDMLWRAHAQGTVEVASGISAMPSLHVGMALWLALVLQKTRLAPIAWVYFGLIGLGSVHLGWHYASDGLVGALGVLALWKLVPVMMQRWTGGCRHPAGSPQAQAL